MLLTPKEILIALQVYLILHGVLYLIKLLGLLLYKHFVTTPHLKAIFNHKYNEHTASDVAVCFTDECGDIKL